MKDQLNRQINYMRISVTDRCNLNCFYCRPPDDTRFLPPGEILSYDELFSLVRLAISLGISRFRLTGGEPLLRPGLEEFISRLTQLREVEDLSLTTNGLLLAESLGKLWQAGLRRINVSLDTLNREKYKATTGSDSLDKVLAAIQKALEVGFHPVKINVVLLKGINEDVNEFIQLAFDWPVHIRFIELMSFAPVDGYFLSAASVLTQLKQSGNWKLVQPLGSGPARYFQLDGMKGSLGFITPYSDHFCHGCNRLRVSANGELRTCLFAQRTYDLKQLLRQGAAEAKLKAFLLAALGEKPSNWQEAMKFHQSGVANKEGLRKIGG